MREELTLTAFSAVLPTRPRSPLTAARDLTRVCCRKQPKIVRRLSKSWKSDARAIYANAPSARTAAAEPGQAREIVEGM